MKIRSTCLLLSVGSWFCLVGQSSAAPAVQRPDDILSDGSAYLWVEAEDVFQLKGDPATGFLVVDKESPIRTIDSAVKGDLDVLPSDTNASGGAAILDQLGGGLNADAATWQVQFAIPETYYLYLHYSFFNRDDNTNYSNEDSIFLPPSFNANAKEDWIGFEGVDGIGDPKTGDSVRDGWMPLFKDIVSEGAIETHNSTDEDYWDGQFHWMWANVAVDVDENNAFVSDLGHGIQYEVTESDVGMTLDFEIGTREDYSTIDALLFSTSPDLLFDFSQEQLDEFFLNLGGTLVGDFDGSGALDLPDVNLLNAEIAAATNAAEFDLSGDGLVNTEDLNNWVVDQRVTWFGDANLDGEFGSGDLVQVFTAGKYELDEDATWGEGDWNGDLRFGSGDIVAAFEDGGFEMGSRQPPANAVPEPPGAILCAIGLAFLARRRRR